MHASVRSALHLISTAPEFWEYGCHRRHTCLRHAANLCECPPAKWRLAFRHSIAQLEELRASVRSRVPEGISRSQELVTGLVCMGLEVACKFLSVGQGTVFVYMAEEPHGLLFSFEAPAA